MTGTNAANLPAGTAGFLDDFESIDTIAELTGATGGSLSVTLQLSGDQVNFYDVIAWTLVPAGAAVAYYKAPLSQATTTSVPVKVGKNLSPALAAGTVVNGSFNAVARLVMVAGAGTSVGAPVVVRLFPQRSRLREGGGA